VNSSVKTQLLHHFNATHAVELETIQSLWSGYGTISRWQLIGVQPETVIVKHVCIPQKLNHPKGWDTAISHGRKLKSYAVETAWYTDFSEKTNAGCRVPKCFFTHKIGEELLVVLEDLDAAGYAVRRAQLELSEVKLVLKWLANFHAQFMQQKPSSLWQEGSYWKLETRPDEWQAMESGWLKDSAKQLAEQLKNCNYQTLIHGDAKVANFCFSEDMKAVAAVDFQYVGGGCGMKDVVYLLGSCLAEWECEKHEEELLNFYFGALNSATEMIDFPELEGEWRRLYAIAWADFTRFLLGWMPSHPKVNAYSLKLVKRAKKILGK